tara:strand:+ start:99060 stop:101003 length:1944 start_codon:yes stop_codon:yes gene_type:complete
MSLKINLRVFVASPLVSHGNVIGVLVVQSLKARKLSVKNEAFITTLASHIALIVNLLPNELKQSSPKTLYSGISASEGVGIGHAYLCQKDSLNDVQISYCDDPVYEKECWLKLLQKVDSDLTVEKEALGQNVSTEIISMFDAYTMLLFDQTLLDKVEFGISEGFSLITSLKNAIQYFAELFLQMDDLYLKARSEDVWHIGNKLYHTFLGNKVDQYFDLLGQEPIILIGEEISVSDIAKIPVTQLKGIVCSGGSKLSHTSIVASALGVPAVMGVQGILEKTFEGVMLVDGNEGKVIINPSDDILTEYLEVIEREKNFEKELATLKHKAAITKNGIHIQLLTNSGLMSDISPGIKHGAEGVGLFRTEIPFICSETFPTEDEQFDIYKNVFNHYKNKPVYMRTLDVGGDKQLPYFPINGEENPAMGWRGIRFTLDNVQLLMTQVRAMLKAAGNTGDLNVLLPMVSSLDEIKTFSNVLNDAMSQLTQEGSVFKKPKLGVMIEVPAAISQIKFWFDDIDFISIGSNDLSQYLLAIDRNNSRVADRFDFVHPAVVFEIYRIVKEARKYNLPVCVCGEMSSDPVSAILLIAMGIKKLSMNSSKIPLVKAMISNLDKSFMDKFLSRALDMSSAKQIRDNGNKLIEEFALLEFNAD